MKLTKSFMATMASLAISAVTSYAQGVPLAPGGSVPAVPIPSPVGAGIINQINVPFASASFNGNLISTVWGGDVSNPLGGLTFTYEVIIAAGPDASSATSIGPFTGFQTDVGYQLPSSIGPGLAPDGISRNPMGSQAVKFDFSSNGYLQPGQNSYLLVVQTAAPSWTLGTATVLDDTGSPNVTVLVPAVVPEPATAGCLLLGLGVLAFTRRFKQN